MLGANSNEAKLKRKCIVIKCAGPRKRSVGVMITMLARLDLIIGAFQLTDSSFELWSLKIPVFRSEMRPTRSKGASAGKVGQVGRSVFISRGRLVGRVRIRRTN